MDVGSFRFLLDALKSLTVQLASALAHMHGLQPETPHGCVRPSVIAVTSAADISLGRCLAASASVPIDTSPMPKRLHTQASLDEVGRSGSLPLPVTFRPARTSSDRLPWLDTVSACTVRRKSNSLSSDLLVPFDAAVKPLVQRSCSDPASTSAEVHGLVTHPSIHTSRRRPLGIHAAEQGVHENRNSCSLKTDENKGGITKAEVPGVGMVFKVSLQMPLRQSSSRGSLFEAAEASVWSRSGVLLSSLRLPWPRGLIALVRAFEFHHIFIVGCANA
jgi:hypothetical protein